MSASSLPYSLELPPGVGLKPLARSEWQNSQNLMGKLLMWEPRKREHRYILGVDVSDGVGKDRSVIEVLRMGTLDRPAEEVAQFVSDEIDPIAFAGVIDSVGRFYRDGEDYEALAAIETNNHGLATQAHLNQHLGYSNLFIWQRWDARDPRKRHSAAFGWYTTSRTRPIILTELRNGITTFDEHTGVADYVLNSPFTLDELKDFQVPPGGAFYQAEAAAGAHDDCLPPEALVQTYRGMVQIDSIAVGEYVLTHTGAFKRVLRVGKRRADSLMEVKGMGKKPIRLTGNHRMLVCRRVRPNGTRPPLMHESPEWLSPDELLLAGCKNYATTTPIVKDSAQSEIWFTLPVPVGYKRENGKLVAYTYNGTRRNPKQNPLPADIKVTKDIARLFGYYAAEGSCGAHSVSWASHKDEFPVRRWLAGVLNQLGQKPCSRPKTANGQILSIGSVVFREFFHSQAGTFQNKRIPLVSLDWPIELLAQVLVGYLVGDGCFRHKGTITAATISPHIVYMIQAISLKCGWRVSVGTRKPQGNGKPVWTLQWSATESAMIQRLFPRAWLRAKHAEIRKVRADQSNIRLHQGYLVGGIRSIKRIPYEGWVYNLDVEDDHSYVVEGTVVHNCIFACAIAYHADITTRYGENEPLADKRRRLAEEHSRKEALAARVNSRVDFQNSDWTFDEMNSGEDQPPIWEGSGPLSEEEKEFV